MKARLPVLLAALSCVLTLVCLVEIASLKSQLAQVENTVVSNVSHVTSQVGNISAQVDEALTRQASILISSDWSFGQADLETFTAPLTFTAVPKEQTPGVTTAALVCGGQTYPMTAGADGSFSVTAELPLFEELTGPRVIFSENGQQRAEALDLTITPAYDCLPFPDYDFPGTSSFSSGTLRYDSELTLWNVSQDEVSSLDLVIVTDGTESRRVPLTLTFLDGSPASVPIDAEIPLAPGSSVKLYAELEETNGLRWRLPLDQWAVDSACQPVDTFYDQFLSIYDSQGNLLWSEDY